MLEFVLGALVFYAVAIAVMLVVWRVRERARLARRVELRGLTGLAVGDGPLRMSGLRAPPPGISPTADYYVSEVLPDGCVRFEPSRFPRLLARRRAQSRKGRS